MYERADPFSLFDEQLRVLLSLEIFNYSKYHYRIIFTDASKDLFIAVKI